MDETNLHPIGSPRCWVTKEKTDRNKNTKTQKHKTKLKGFFPKKEEEKRKNPRNQETKKPRNQETKKSTTWHH